MREFAALAVPGLLQTEEYARALFRSRPKASGSEIEEMVTARMQRQAILSGPNPPMLWVVFDEGAFTVPSALQTAIPRCCTTSWTSLPR